MSLLLLFAGAVHRRDNGGGRPRVQLTAEQAGRRRAAFLAAKAAEEAQEREIAATAESRAKAFRRIAQGLPAEAPEAAPVATHTAQALEQNPWRGLAGFQAQADEYDEDEAIANMLLA